MAGTYEARWGYNYLNEPLISIYVGGTYITSFFPDSLQRTLARSHNDWAECSEPLMSKPLARAYADLLAKDRLKHGAELIEALERAHE